MGWVWFYVKMSFSNDCGTLGFHKQSLKGAVQDYVIEFKQNQVDIAIIVGDTYELFSKLMEKFNDKIVRARLVAKMHFYHFGKEEVQDRFYHFGSYSSEVVNEPREFFERHMMKISQRLDQFNSHGSDLVLKTISHIHIQLSFRQKR